MEMFQHDGFHSIVMEQFHSVRILVSASNIKELYRHCTPILIS